MNTATLFSFLLAGFLGGPHCVGMCGGIASAFGGATVTRPPGRAKGRTSDFYLHVGYHIGRISSYVIAGALAGGLGSALLLTEVNSVRITLFALAGIMLFGMGMSLWGFPHLLRPFERIGAFFWKRLQPKSLPFFPVRHLRQAVPLGFIWGWVPCGMIYAGLTSALASGQSTEGALILLAFGLGTLPNMLLAGLFASEVRVWLTHRAVRMVAGSVVIWFGVSALYTVVQMGMP